MRNDNQVERTTITNEFIERDAHMVPRNRRMKCARCEKWMTVDQLEPRQECPHCREAGPFDLAPSRSLSAIGSHNP